MSTLERASGLLMHPTSLPSPFGIGDLGKVAYAWIDFLAASQQTVWQILPLGPTGYGDSPYQTSSVFAGNPLLIDPVRLFEKGYLSEAELNNWPQFPEERVDYAEVINWKIPLLLKAAGRFVEKASPEDRSAYASFCDTHNDRWLNEFALFMAIKYDQGQQCWNSWPEPLKLRNPQALEEARQKLSGEISAHKFLQFCFFEQWASLRRYAREKGVQIMGDIPIYTTYDSAEVWSDQELFYLDKNGDPTVVAGVPPDYFSKTGQLWGNPIYRWDKMAKRGFQWWIERVRINMDLVDLVRIDHFRGFEAYWAVPYGDPTAEHGTWKKGPGKKFFSTLLNALGEVPIIAEDLGFITPEVRELRESFGFPGMKILQFAWGAGPSDPFLPHNYDPNCVAYTGSHDNDTTLGWYATAPDHERRYLHDYLGYPTDDIAGALIRLAMTSTARLAIIPTQDLLRLGGEARMNFPGRAEGNWSWRLRPNQLNDDHLGYLRHLSGISNRVPKSPDEESA